MSIAPPSDIILDVAQAADPQRLLAATAKLAQMAAGASGSVDFNTELASVRGASGLPSLHQGTVAVPDDRATRIDTKPTSPYQKFEAMVLQNFLESMLPKDTELFGDAASADACRSMLADQLATQLAKTGRIGIARSIDQAHGAASGDRQAAAMRAADTAQVAEAASIAAGRARATAL